MKNELLNLAELFNKRGFFRAARLCDKLATPIIDPTKYPEIAMAKVVVKTNVSDIKTAIRKSPFSVIVFDKIDAKVRDINISYVKAEVYNDEVIRDFDRARSVFEHALKSGKHDAVVLTNETGGVRMMEPKDNMHLVRDFLNGEVRVEQVEQVKEEAKSRLPDTPIRPLHMPQPSKPTRDGIAKWDTVYGYYYEPFFYKFDEPDAEGRTGFTGKRKIKVVDWVWDGHKWLSGPEFKMLLGQPIEEDEKKKKGPSAKEEEKKLPQWKTTPTPKAEYREKMEEALKGFDPTKVQRNVSGPVKKEKEYERVTPGAAPRHKDPF